LDAVSKLALRDFLKTENRKNGVTMILTTHDIDDIESLCSKVMVIGRGKLLFNGNLDELKERFAPLRRIRATLNEHIDKFPVEGAVEIIVDGNTWSVFFDPNKTPAHSMVAELAEKLPLRDIVIEEQDIDEIIAAMYKEMCL
jgi:ABC-2 type transport system ATP-binding protein